MTTLRADRCSFRYPDGPDVLEGTSVAVKPGEFVVLLGANGSGKTTLLRVLAGHLRAREGVALLDEVAIASLSRRLVAQRVALMPQFEHRETGLSVREVVRLGRSPHCGWWLPLSADDERIVDQSMAATGVLPLAERRITHLSGGEWRRMVLARALAQEASVLLLDEPTAGLDVRYQYECLVALQRMVRSRNLAAIVTLHDLNLAALFADRVSILARGRCVASGSPGEALTAEVVRHAFGIEVSVIPHPLHGTPMVVPNLHAVTPSQPHRAGLLEGKTLT
jgi:iron complex transport system ATP-binding protein